MITMKTRSERDDETKKYRNIYSHKATVALL